MCSTSTQSRVSGVGVLVAGEDISLFKEGERELSPSHSFIQIYIDRSSTRAGCRRVLMTHFCYSKFTVYKATYRELPTRAVPVARSLGQETGRAPFARLQ